MTEELDELNRLFTSKNVDDVIKFYDHFENAEQLIEWMKNRPSAPMKIYEVEGDKDIVIVIPTADHNGEYAKNCANEIFKGQQIVFVESNGPFFNYARSCNFGLKYALGYYPKWIILSNDDVTKYDDFKKLRLQLSKLDSKSTDVAFLKNNAFRPYDISSILVRETALLHFFRKFSKNHYYQALKDKFNLQLDVIGKRRLLKRFNSFFYHNLKQFYDFFDFIIISSDYLSSCNEFFDSIFINGYEDHFRSYILANENRAESFVDFNIGSVGGYTLGSNYIRKLREIVPLIYFNYAIKKLNKTKYGVYD